MESTTAGKSTGPLKTVAAIVAVLALVGSVWAYRALHTTPLRSLVRGGLPMLDLNLHFIDINGEEIDAAQTRLASIPAQHDNPAAGPDTCPEIKGGDIRGSDPKAAEKAPATCPKTASWYVKRHPVGFSLSINEPKKFLALFEQDGTVRELWKSRFIQGILHDPLRNSSIRAEDLGVQGLQGAFLAGLLKETLAAHGQLHYDAVHGRKGFVYSFVRNQCPYAAKALPVIAGVLARSGYTAKNLKEPILEMRIGLQRVFITEYGTRVYIANGLEALLNVMESLPSATKDTAASTVVLRVRAEAFAGTLPLAMTGEQEFPLDFGFGLSQESPDVLRFPAGKFARHLRPRVYKGVLAGIPGDVFAAVVTSFSLPLTMTPQEWRRLAVDGPGEQPANGPEEGGLAVIWDLSSAGQEITAIGVVIANQTDPDATRKLNAYFSKPGLTAQCGGGTVFLAATSQPLLTRMKESCERQSLSMLDWERGQRSEEFSARQLVFFMNPGTGAKELFLAGGAQGKELEPAADHRREQYEKAKAGMRQECEQVFASLPIFTYSGNVGQTAGTVLLQGHKVRQEAAQ